MSDRQKTLVAFGETLAFPDLSAVYDRFGIRVVRVDSVRKALAEVKKSTPDFILAEFVYAWGNNYASCHIGNLDSLLASVPKYAPQARVIVLHQRADLEHVRRLGELYEFHRTAPMPVDTGALEALLLG